MCIILLEKIIAPMSLYRGFGEPAFLGGPLPRPLTSLSPAGLLGPLPGQRVHSLDQKELDLP